MTASAGPAEYFEPSSDEGRPAGGERPSALPEPRSQAAHVVGFVLVLNPIVQQLGRELVRHVDIPVPCCQDPSWRSSKSTPGQGPSVHAPAPVVEFFSPAPMCFIRQRQC